MFFLLFMFFCILYIFFEAPIIVKILKLIKYYNSIFLIFIFSNHMLSFYIKRKNKKRNIHSTSANLEYLKICKS